MERIGLYGGTFAPPHYGHIHAVKTFLAAIPVDRLFVMPTYQPPHKAKASGDTPEVRLEMCRAAFGTIPGVQVSDYEIRKANVSYTVETLRYLTKPGRQIYLLCGTDMFLTLDRWYCAEEIFRLTEIVCMTRTDEKKTQIAETAARYRSQYGKESIMLDAEPVVISSTEIRTALQQGESLAAWVPPAVECIMRRDGLYQGVES